MDVDPSANVSVGENINYRCKPGFSLNGTSSMNCTLSGFTSEPPVCKGNINAINTNLRIFVLLKRLSGCQIACLLLCINYN